MIEMQPAWRVSDAVVCADLGDEVVLLDTVTGIYYGLDQVGASIWDHLTKGEDAPAILAGLLTEYEVEPRTLQADLDAFLALLVARGLLIQGHPE